MDDEARVQILEGLGKLIDYESDVHFLKDTLSYDVVQIRFHELENEVYVLVVVGLERLVESDDVGMLQLFEYFDFAVGALGVGGMLEGVEYFFKSVDPFTELVLYLPNVAVRSGSYLLEDVELGEDVRLDGDLLSLRHDVKYNGLLAFTVFV